MSQSREKNLKPTPKARRRVKRNARLRKVPEADVALRSVERRIATEGIDMVAAIGKDFGCVKSGDSRSLKEKLAGFGRAHAR